MSQRVQFFLCGTRAEGRAGSNGKGAAALDEPYTRSPKVLSVADQVLPKETRQFFSREAHTSGLSEPRSGVACVRSWFLVALIDVQPVITARCAASLGQAPYGQGNRRNAQMKASVSGIALRPCLLP